MNIAELHTLTEAQLEELQGLMVELDPEITVTAEMLQQAASAPGTHLFAAETEEGQIVGCASLCVFDSPTGRKASLEDVVVSSRQRGQGLGKQLMEHILRYAARELGNVDLHLTSRPHRVAANALYRSLGFQQRETNFYKLEIRK